MELKRKKESKWLIVENRKVHCYLCGRKMLKASQRIYEAESGHYSHAICEKEKQLTGTNERRSAVKKIVAGAGVLGLTAVGVDKFTSFGRMSNSVFSSNAKDQTANPELETVITSQGIILPSLTSDPANPVAGQMWYRSDAGVTAHYDSIQNRVVYSSEINNGNVNVTSKGIINGLSVLPNDGTGGFGPDTTLDATSVGQIGSPYTQTSGILESVNSCSGNNVTITLLEGVFLLYSSIKIPSTLQGIRINGVNSLNTILRAVGSNFTNITNTLSDLPNSSSEITPIIYFDGINNLTHYDIGNFTIDANSSNVTIPSDSQGIFLYLQQNSETTVRGYIHDIVPLNFQGASSTGAIPYSIITTYSEGIMLDRIWGTTNTETDGNIYTHAPGGAIYLSRILAYTYQFYTKIIYATAVTLNSTLLGTGFAVFLGLYINASPGTLGSIHSFQYKLYISIFGGEIANDSATIGFFTGAFNIYATVNNTTFYGNGNSLYSGSASLFYYDNQTVFYQNVVLNANEPTISTNPPVSGTVYQNTNPYPIEIDLPVYATTSGTAGYVTIAKGSTDTPTAIANQYVSGDTSSTATQIIKVRVPAGWYYSFTGSGVTFATATPFAE